MNATLNTVEQSEVAALRRQLAETEARLEKAERSLRDRDRLIDRLERRIRELVHARWGRSSERHPGQGELSLFDEAELAAMDIGGPGDGDAVGEPDVDAAAGGGDGTGGSSGTAQPEKRRRRRRALPDDLERVRVEHELQAAERRCPCGCGAEMVVIGEEITEQLGILPQRHFVIQHVKIKYASPCKAGGVKTAPMPPAPIPGAQASAGLLGWSMVAKYHDALPLYRQEKIAARFGVELPRSKLARWLIAASRLLQPLYNLMEEALFDYDIVATDDTGIQVLKEDGRAASTKSALWLRRGGVPATPVVLVDYDRTKSEAAARPLLDRAHGYLVSDAAAVFKHLVAAQGLRSVLCNDHARRKFAEASRTATAGRKGAKGKTGARAQGPPAPWIATKAIGFYQRLYRIEREATKAGLTSHQRRERRERQAVPVWEEFMGWARRMQLEGVRDAKTRAALAYLLEHEAGLRRYCEDGRLPISNIRCEHVAKTIAVARKNFLFADTTAGASASARILSVLESAKVNGQNVLEYVTVVLDEMPRASTVEEVEALLPWRLRPEEVRRRYAALPAPGRKNADPAP